MVDHRHRIVGWNKGAQELLGHARDDVLNRPCVRARGPDARRAVAWTRLPAFTGVARDDLPKGMEVQVHTREGRQVWLHFSLIVVPHEPGPLMVHVVHDVSPHMRASEFVAQVASMWQANGVLRDSGLTGDASTPTQTPAAAFTTRSVRSCA